jgi:hypothetical protein
MTKSPGPVAQGKMQPKPGSPPGIELDGKGHVIPLEKRTLDDQEKAAANSSIKNPDDEAENPSPMPRDLQGRGAVRP